MNWRLNCIAQCNNIYKYRPISLRRSTIVTILYCLNILFLRMVILSFVLCLRAESIFVKQITFFYRIGCIRF